MKTMARRAAMLTGLTLAVACAGLAPAAVANPTDRRTDRAVTPETVRVSGEQVPVDAENGKYVMRGGLVGKWQYIPQTTLHDVPTLYVEAGKEIFKGCIDRSPKNGRCNDGEPQGELYLAFLFWASYSVTGEEQTLIKGQCVHPIIGGRGSFVGARGVLDMVDLPVGDEVKTSYRGHIVLNAVREGPGPWPKVPAGSDAQTIAVTSPARGC